MVNQPELRMYENVTRKTSTLYYNNVNRIRVGRLRRQFEILMGTN